MTAPVGARLRCGVHPSRPAVDSCPVCGRLRCGADAAAAGEHGHGCPSCGGSSSEPRRPAAGRGPSELERYVRAALGATVAALVWGKVTSEYVGSTFFSDISPALLGVACGAAATRAAGSDGSGRTGLRVRVRLRPARDGLLLRRRGRLQPARAPPRRAAPVRGERRWGAAVDAPAAQGGQGRAKRVKYRTSGSAAAQRGPTTNTSTLPGLVEGSATISAGRPA